LCILSFFQRKVITYVFWHFHFCCQWHMLAQWAKWAWQYRPVSEVVTSEKVTLVSLNSLILQENKLNVYFISIFLCLNNLHTIWAINHKIPSRFDCFVPNLVKPFHYNLLSLANKATPSLSILHARTQHEIH
jgi:hypothetical protein